MSSSSIPPKEWLIRVIISASCSGSLQSISISIASRPDNALMRAALPSITGLDAAAPVLPKPNTAVPLVMTATKFPLLV